MAVILFAGPTGVGKTELVKLVAEELDVEMVRFDMSEFSHVSEISRFVGAPVGYKDSEQGGQLTNALKSNKVKVVLFDEIEKATPEIYKIFLQLFDEGRLTDGKGESISAKNNLFFMTSNLGGPIIAEKYNEGYTQKEIKKLLEPQFIKTFRPELYNRMQNIVFFRPLNEEVIKDITKQTLTNMSKDIYNKKKIKINWDQSIIEHLVEQGYDSKMGVRAMHRTVNDIIRPIIVDSYLKKEINEGYLIKLQIININGNNQVKVIITDKHYVKNEDRKLNIQGLTYYDGTPKAPRNLIGKLAIRIEDSSSYQGEKNLAFTRDPILIISVNRENCISYYNGYTNRLTYDNIIDNNYVNKNTRKLSEIWNDKKWIEPRIDQNAPAFIYNQCVSLKNEFSKQECLKSWHTVVDKLYYSNINSLPYNEPLTTLLEKCETISLDEQELCREGVITLKKLLKLKKVIIGNNESESFFSTKNYDFKKN